MQPMKVSIVIPVFNEEKSLPLLFEELTSTFKTLKRDAEVIFVDDGSTDNSASSLQLLTPGLKMNVKIIRLRRNFGQTAAIAAGIEKAKGNSIVFMDADLQNDPADIPKLIKKLDQGFDVVSGWRKNRHDPYFSRVLPSKIANKIISFVTGVHLKDYGCTLKAYRREILENVSLYGEMHRFLPALCVWQGGSIAEIEVTHHPRKFGKSKYGLIRTFKVILDLITVKFLSFYMTKPIYVFGGIGLLSMGFGVVIAAYIIYAKLFIHGFYIIESPLFIVSVFLEIVGVIFVLMGLLAEILVRIYYESQGKKPYVVRE